MNDEDRGLLIGHLFLVAGALLATVVSPVARFAARDAVPSLATLVVLVLLSFLALF